MKQIIYKEDVGVFYHIVLTEIPSTDFLTLCGGYFADIFRNPNGEGIRIILYSISEYDMVVIQEVIAALIEDGFVEPK